jgi:hypothetical protein
MWHLFCFEPADGSTHSLQTNNVLAKNLIGCLAAVAITFTAVADSISLSAFYNSSNGGTGVFVGNVIAGQTLSVKVNVADLWVPSPLPRLSETGGTTGAGGGAGSPPDKSSNGHAQSGSQAQYGSLEGKIGDHTFVIGPQFNGQLPWSGPLILFFLDEAPRRNWGTVTAEVSVTSETALTDGGSIAVLLGLALVGTELVRRRLNR